MHILDRREVLTEGLSGAEHSYSNFPCDVFKCEQYLINYRYYIADIVDHSYLCNVNSTSIIINGIFGKTMEELGFENGVWQDYFEYRG